MTKIQYNKILLNNKRGKHNLAFKAKAAPQTYYHADYVIITTYTTSHFTLFLEAFLASSFNLQRYEIFYI